MARYRYLNCSEPVAARWLAGEALRRRRPRRASRARMYVTHPGRDLAPLTLAVRQWLGRVAPSPEPLPPALSLPRRAADAAPLRSRMPEPRTSVEQAPEPPAASSALAAVETTTNPASGAPPRVIQTPFLTPGGAFTNAVSSRPRIRALREAIHSRTRPESAPTRKGRAAARLRVRTATIRATTRMTADRDGLWKDSLAAARILKRNLGRAA